MATGDQDEKKAPLPLVAVSLVALLIGGFALIPRLFQPREGALVGKAAPDFTLDVVANTTPSRLTAPKITLSDLKGSVVVLDFWATWCGPCQAEAPIVDKLAARFRDRGVVVVGVNTSDQASNARAWAIARGLSFPIVYDAGETAARAYGVESLPTLVVVSRTGKVAAMRTGVTDDAELEALVTQNL